MTYEDFPRRIVYNYDKAIAHSESLGYHWDADGMMLADRMFHEIQMSQEQVDTALYCHIKRLSVLTNPRSYSWPQRFLMVLYWLGIVGRKIPRVR